MPKARILVVDKNPVTLRVIHKMLRDKDYEALTASSVNIAMKYLNEDPTIDLVLAEVDMPQLDAFQLMHQFEQLPRLKNLPVILCSGSGNEKTIARAQASGARDIIVKPFKAEALASKIDQVLIGDLPGVLIIEDEVTVSDQLRQIIEPEGFTVYAEAGADKGLLALADYKVDIVIADVGLPEMSGRELASQIKKLYQNIPVLLVTGLPDEYNQNMVLAYGAVGYISRPFNKDAIIKQLHDISRSYPPEKTRSLAGLTDSANH